MLKFKTVKLEFQPAVLEFIKTETKKRLQQFTELEESEKSQQLAAEENHSKKRGYLIGYIAFNRALRRLKASPPLYIFRPADFWRFWGFKLKFIFRPNSVSDKEKEEGPIFYYETFGYRFVIFFDPPDSKGNILKGSVVYICPVKDKQNDDPEECREKANRDVNALKSSDDQFDENNS